MPYYPTGRALMEDPIPEVRACLCRSLVALVVTCDSQSRLPLREPAVQAEDEDYNGLTSLLDLFTVSGPFVIPFS